MMLGECYEPQCASNEIITLVSVQCVACDDYTSPSSDKRSCIAPDCDSDEITTKIG